MAKSLKDKKPGDKEYIIVVDEYVKRRRHYHIWAKDADEAERKMSEGTLNVIFKESSPANEKLEVQDWNMVETILPPED